MSPSSSPIPGFKMILMGAPGTIKTASIRSLNGTGIDPRLLAIDPNYSSALESSHGLTGIKHWRYIPIATASWSTLISNARMINTMNNETLQKMANVSGSHYTQFIDILTQCNEFKTHDGDNLGDISTWGTDCCLILDGLSGLSEASEKLTVGAKPVKTQPDWGVMMDNLLNYLQKIAKDSWCHVVLIAHLDRETDLITGGVKTMPSTLGRKLAPRLPKDWTDVVLAKKVGDRFSWSTTDATADLKAMHLPLKDDLKPDFAQVVDGWKAKGGIIAPGRPA